MADPRLFELSVELWHALRDSEHTSGGTGVIGVFEGSMTEAFRSAKISMTHYSPLYAILQEMGCIVVERKGRRDIKSRIILREAPTLELYERHVHAIGNRLTKTGNDAILQLSQRVSNIEGRLQGVDLQSALLDFEHRLQVLEDKGDN